MKLLRMRDLDANDPLPGLGPKVVPTPAPTPPPAPAQVPGAREGVLVGPDGKMSTDLPLPYGIWFSRHNKVYSHTQDRYITIWDPLP
jgi:hypothetical protein